MLGRFGWKAAVPSVEEQNAGAFAGDIGITSSLRPDQPCTRLQAECIGAPTAATPSSTTTSSTRSPSTRARWPCRPAATSAPPDTRAGQETFDEIGCASCHVGELQTGDSDIAALDEQVIRPYTDLLLHDMGPGLADGRPELDGTGAVVGTPDLDPSGQEWRTPPLWGIGLVETVNRHTRFLHDGRARSLEEAILWHGGEAEPARDRFLALDARERAAVLAFLESL